MNGLLFTIKTFAAERCFDTVLFGNVCDDCNGTIVLKLFILLVQILTAGVVVAGTIGVIITGATVMMAREDAAKVAKAKSRFFAICIGLVCWALFFLIGNFIIPGGFTLDVPASSSSCPDSVNVQPITPGSPLNPDHPLEPGGPSSPSTPSDPSDPTSPSTPGGNVPGADQIAGYTPAKQSPTGTTTFNGVGESWIMVNTKFSVPDYMNSLKKRKVAQDKKDCYDNGNCVDPSTRDNDKCLSFAYTFAHDLIHKTTTCDHCASQYKRGSFASIKTQSKEDALTMIYDQLSHGWPVVVQVKYYPNGTGRHFVTAVGYKSSVTSRANFTEDDILFLNTDGKLWRSDGVGKVGQPGGGVGSTKSSLKLFKKDYGYYVLPATNPNPDAKANNMTSC
jgi:hypothetical protein